VSWNVNASSPVQGLDVGVAMTEKPLKSSDSILGSVYEIYFELFGSSFPIFGRFFLENRRLSQSKNL
jgi:hypothetical protein